MLRAIAIQTTRSLASRSLAPAALSAVTLSHISSRPLLPRTTRNLPGMMNRMPFHSSAPRKNPVLYGLLASLLKSSASIEIAKTATRIVLTLLPLSVIKNYATRKYLKHVIRDRPDMEENKLRIQKCLRKRVMFTRFLFAIPFVIVSLTLLASLERTPISGRWRLILLSPEEEESISNQLKGTGWYQAILQVISNDGPPDIIPPSDWRYQWVQQVLRHLEQTIPTLAREHSANLPWFERGPDDVPLPPPSKYPLSPRSSAKDYLRWFCDSTAAGAQVPFGTPHLIPGPPYNLVLVERPECDNAFSFGFGPDGAGGIVVYSGFIDRILRETSSNTEGIEDATSFGTQPPRSPLSRFLGLIFPFLSASTPANPTVPPPTIPTHEQTTQLAILLAHELAHLILAHHLETLSSGTIVVPGMLSIVADLIRAALFPVTMFFGPFVNDAVANLGKVGSGEVAKLSDHCTGMAQEFEADAVSTRILAYAGFDARKTIEFWENRRAASLSECSPFQAAQHKARLSATQPGNNADNAEESTDSPSADEEMLLPPSPSEMLSVSASLARQIVGATHPLHESRVLRLRSELQRWEMERERALRKRRQMAEQEGIQGRTFGKEESSA